MVNDSETGKANLTLREWLRQKGLGWLFGDNVSPQAVLQAVQSNLSIEPTPLKTETLPRPRSHIEGLVKLSDLNTDHWRWGVLFDSAPFANLGTHQDTRNLLRYAILETDVEGIAPLHGFSEMREREIEEILQVIVNHLNADIPPVYEDSLMDGDPKKRPSQSLEALHINIYHPGEVAIGQVVASLLKHVAYKLKGHGNKDGRQTMIVVDLDKDLRMSQEREIAHIVKDLQQRCALRDGLLETANLILYTSTIFPSDLQQLLDLLNAELLKYHPAQKGNAKLPTRVVVLTTQSNQYGQKIGWVEQQLRLVKQYDEKRAPSTHYSTIAEMDYSIGRPSLEQFAVWMPKELWERIITHKGNAEAWHFMIGEDLFMLKAFEKAAKTLNSTEMTEKFLIEVLHNIMESKGIHEEFSRSSEVMQRLLLLAGCVSADGKVESNWHETVYADRPNLDEARRGSFIAVITPLFSDKNNKMFDSRVARILGKLRGRAHIANASVFEAAAKTVSLEKEVVAFQCAYCSSFRSDITIDAQTGVLHGGSCPHCNANELTPSGSTYLLGIAKKMHLVVDQSGARWVPYSN